MSTDQATIIGTTIVVVSLFTVATITTCGFKTKKVETRQSLEEYIAERKTFKNHDLEIEFLENQDEASLFLKGFNRDFLNFGKTSLSDAEHTWRMLRKPKGLNVNPNELDRFLDSINFAESKYKNFYKELWPENISNVHDYNVWCEAEFFTRKKVLVENFLSNNYCSVSTFSSVNKSFLEHLFFCSCGKTVMSACLFYTVAQCINLYRKR